MRIRNLVIALAFIIAIAAAIILPSGAGASLKGGGSDLPPGASARKANATAGARQAFTVRSIPAIREDLQSYLELNGEVDFVAKLDVYPDTGGRIEWLSVQPGDQVRKGQVLARIDPSRPGERYELSPVYAPAAGTIVAVYLAEGATLSTSTAILRIAKSDELEIKAKVNERDIAVLATGLKATLSLEAWPGVSFSATVTRVSPVVDATSRTKEIVIKLSQPDSRVNAGMFAKIRLDTTLHRNLVTVPANALVSYYDERYVWILREDDTVQRRSVVPGLIVDGRASIRLGLAEGERVILEGIQVLSNGAKVRDMATDTASGLAASAVAPEVSVGGGAQ